MSTMDDERPGSDEFERGRRAGREELAKLIRECAEHTHKNAAKLLKYGGSAAVESRCREWGAMLIDEAVECAELGDRHREHLQRMDDFERLTRQVDAFLAETGGA